MSLWCQPSQGLSLWVISKQSYFRDYVSQMPSSYQLNYVEFQLNAVLSSTFTILRAKTQISFCTYTQPFASKFPTEELIEFLHLEYVSSFGYCVNIPPLMHELLKKGKKKFADLQKNIKLSDYLKRNDTLLSCVMVVAFSTPQTDRIS